MLKLTSKLTFALSFVFAACLGFSTAAVASCSEVYSGAVADVSILKRSIFEYDKLFTTHCETNGEIRKESLNLDLRVPVKGVDYEFDGSRDEAQERMQQFCKSHLAESLKIVDEDNYERTITTSALKSFNECRQLELAGVNVSHTAQPPESLIIVVNFDGDKTNVRFDALTYSRDEGTCTTTGYSGDDKPVVLNGETAAKELKKPFNIVCVRTATAKDGSKHFNRFTVGLATNHGPYSVELPADDLFGFDLALQAKINLDQKESELKAKQSEIADIKADDPERWLYRYSSNATQIATWLNSDCKPDQITGIRGFVHQAGKAQNYNFHVYCYRGSGKLGPVIIQEQSWADDRLALLREPIKTGFAILGFYWGEGGSSMFVVVPQK